ncbi:MAG: nucleotidyltransferase domain-containing protein [Chloroflexi bacterium]|nr:nucleotidyltransferase domain-containing protein [Chloroflexota bacterium]
MIPDEQLARLQQVFLQHGVTLAYLFGSQAEGAPRPSSDVDIAVLLPHGAFTQLSTDGYLRLVTDTMGALDRDDVDVVYLNEAPPLLAFEVVRHGLILHEDPELRPAVDFALRTLNRYVDTACFRRLTWQYLAERVEARRLHGRLVAQEAGDD